MVLEWRNSDHIRRYALQQHTVTMQEHLDWFSNAAQRGDHYFVIEESHTPVGLVWAQKIDGEKCESGFYLYDKQVQNSLLAYRVILLLHHYLFNELHLKTIECLILDSNHRAKRFNLSLGFKPIENYPGYARYALTQTDYAAAEKQIMRLLKVTL